ncbi:Met-10+ like-protein-domain-containing protein [Naematelia encephala]|uniref:tRNA (guanine(37)-N1)-methyltransferase n=1 Tax=Naematelia encephala TaxID=71784 RepID=A0A1Y2BIQ7_9TREE|nr:Met-10+ like-protein-domain-containing protein [Naematelia encephala]
MASSSRPRPPVPNLASTIRPPSLIGMTTLDRDAFRQYIPLLGVQVEPRKTGAVRNHPLVRRYLLDLPKIPPISDNPHDPKTRLLRLKVKSEDELPSEVLEVLKVEGVGLTGYDLEINYDYWNLGDILHAILPTTVDEDIPSSFTSTGHIGHVNLRAEWLPYKHLIGQVILDKNPTLRTVVNKLNEIHATYRYFDMEVIAGDKDYITTLSESGCTFTLDFSQVYWNSRLHHEHERLVDLFPVNSVVADVMAGVGPFAVPAAKKGVGVLGNDLNPEGVKWMRENRIKNKVQDTLRVYEMDGREFIRRSNEIVWSEPFPPFVAPLTSRQRDKARREARRAQAAKADPSSSSSPSPASPPEDSPSSSAPFPSLPDHVPSHPPTQGDSSENNVAAPMLVQHYIMNLPDSALEFLDAFRGLYDPLKSDPVFQRRLAEGTIQFPLVHVYCFTRFLDVEEASKDICERASQRLSYNLTPSEQDFNLHLVRSVAPNKDMYCLTFRLPREVALSEVASEQT